MIRIDLSQSHDFHSVVLLPWLADKGLDLIRTAQSNQVETLALLLLNTDVTHSENLMSYICRQRYLDKLVNVGNCL